MTDKDELMETLLAHLNNLHCYNCGKAIGRLWFESGDESEGLDELIYWECPEGEKRPTKVNDIIIELTNLNEESIRTIKRELKELIDSYRSKKMLGDCISVTEMGKER